MSQPPSNLVHDPRSVGTVSLEPADKLLHWPVTLKKEQWALLQVDLMEAAVQMRIAAFPGLWAIVVEAQCVLTLQTYVVVRVCVTQFDDGN